MLPAPLRIRETNRKRKVSDCANTANPWIRVPVLISATDLGNKSLDSQARGSKMCAMKAEFPTTLREAIQYFADDETAFEFMKNLRWPDGVVRCPQCDGTTVSFISTRKLWTCRECKTRKQFTIRVGTILEDSPIKFDKWICAFWLIANAKNGISSYEIGRSLGVTQRTGWFMLQRIRLALQNGTIVKIGGHVEAAETFISEKGANNR